MKTALLLGLALGALGCANHIMLAAAPADPEVRREAIPSALVIDWVETRRAGFEANPSTDLIANCARILRSSRTFDEVYEPRRSYAAPAGSFHLGIRIDESFDRHAAAAGSKLVATIVTGGFPGAFLPFYHDDRVVVEGELRTPGGASHFYRVERAGTIRSFLLIGLTNAERDLRDRVWGEALRSFAIAITSDATIAPPSGAPEPSP